MIHFLKNLMIAGGLLQVATFGAGKFSIDAQLDRRGISARGNSSRAIA
jgi:putative oxidoreductase